MSEDTLFCYRHPKEATGVTCTRCERPICYKCMVNTPVGFKCRNCGQYKSAVYQLSVLQLVIGVVVGLIGGGIGGLVGTSLGFLVCFLGPVIGGFVGELVSICIGRHHSRVIALFVGAGIVIGAVGGPAIRILLLKPVT